MGAGLGMKYWWPWHPILAAFLLIMLLPFVLAWYALKLLVLLIIVLVRWHRQRAVQGALDAPRSAD